MDFDGKLRSRGLGCDPLSGKSSEGSKAYLWTFFFFLNSSLEDMLTDFREREGETEEGKHLV